MRASRRTVLLGGAAAAAVGGGGWIAAGHTARYLEGLLTVLLEEEAPAREDVSRFVVDYLASATDDTRRNAAALAKAAQAIGPRGVDALLGEVTAYDFFRRSFMTKFMLSSNFFTRAEGEPLVYHALTPVCSNPFARLS